jgi:hypothetical protein
VPEDLCLFVGYKVVLVIFVDDMIIVYHKRHKEEALTLKHMLIQAYELKDLGEVSRFIGVRITRDRPTRRL